MRCSINRRRFGHDVVFVELYRIVDVTQCSTGRSSYESGVTDDDRAVRYVEVNIRTGCDKNVVADGDVADDNSIRTNPYEVADMRCTLPLASELRTDYNTC